jgi:hypothetical protein
LALRARVFLFDFFDPSSMPDRSDPVQIGPEVEPMRHFRLKPGQLATGVVAAVATEVDAFLSGAGEHLA